MSNSSRCFVPGLCALGALTVAATLAGCAGPTKAGREARTEARDRMSLVNAQIGYDQARRAFDVGQFDRAMREITNAIDRSPDEPEFHLLQGRIFLEQHRLESALTCFKRAIDLTTTDDAREPALMPTVTAKAHYFAGIVHQRWSDYANAHASYQQAADIDPNNVQYPLASAEALIAMERYEDALDLIKPAMAHFEHNAALRHLLGQIALLQGDAPKAVLLLSEARLLSPDDLFLLEELARAQFAAEMFGRCHESLLLLDRLRLAAASNEQPRTQPTTTGTRTDLLHMKARCLMMTGRAIDARQDYIELTGLVPGQVEPWIELGALSYEIGDMRRLATAATRVTALVPDRWEGPFLTAMYEIRMATEQGTPNAEALDRAVRLLEQSAKKAEQAGAEPSTVPHLMLGRLLEQRGDNESARNAYARARRIDPNDRHAEAFFGGVSSAISAVPVE